MLFQMTLCTEAKWDSTPEVCFRCKKQKDGGALDQPCSLLLPFFTIEDGLIRAEASLALTKKVDISSLSCEVVDRE